MSLDPEQLDRYWETGWLAAEGVFEPEEADRVGDALLAIADREREAAKPGYNVDISSDGAQAPRKINQPFVKDPLFRSFLLDKRLTGPLESLLGDKPFLMIDHPCRQILVQKSFLPSLVRDFFRWLDVKNSHQLIVPNEEHKLSES